MPRQPVQTPGDTAATSNPTDTSKDTQGASAGASDSGAANAATGPTLADTAGAQQMADLQAAGAAKEAADENTMLREQVAMMQKQMADLQAIVRKTVENVPVAVEKKLPTPAEAMKQNPNQPVLTTEGHYVPPSENWAVSAGNSNRRA